MCTESTVNMEFNSLLSTLKILIQSYTCIHFFYSCDFVELTDIFGQRIERLSGSRSGFTVTVRADRTSSYVVIVHESSSEKICCCW